MLGLVLLQVRHFVPFCDGNYSGFIHCEQKSLVEHDEQPSILQLRQFPLEVLKYCSLQAIHVPNTSQTSHPYRMQL